MLLSILYNDNIYMISLMDDITYMYTNIQSSSSKTTIILYIMRGTSTSYVTTLYNERFTTANINILSHNIIQRKIYNSQHQHLSITSWPKSPNNATNWEWIMLTEKEINEEHESTMEKIWESCVIQGTKDEKSANRDNIILM
jgi:hypothetical protein